MGFSFEKSILPMSELRANLDKVKNQLKNSPVIITNNGRPDFGVCDLETLTIAMRIKELRDLLKERLMARHQAVDAEPAFKKLREKYHV